MNLAALKPYVLRYTLLAGPVVAALVLGTSALGGVSLPTASFFFGVAMLVCAPLPFAASDAGLDTTSAGVQGGFDVTDPSSLQPQGIPGRLGLAFTALGAGLTSIAVFLATSGVLG
ncbi:hypothetical protein [Haloarchaeobius amylolyticus]|uniref:hypothetical protein n=1 Tax=Haloarchaeobius amylolyticus TaxID=1198296 RepID=UPI002271E2CB|nr:hypothetical protein [Haloarchaeobius amylolyticus]